MASNTSSSYGRDVACFDDADALWSDVTGLDIVKQDVYHRLTNDSVLGSTPDDANADADNFGFDVTRLAGMSVADLALIPPQISAAVQKDPRIATCDVSIQKDQRSHGQLWSVVVTVICTTALGPFTLVLGVSSDGFTVAILGGKAS